MEVRHSKVIQPTPNFVVEWLIGLLFVFWTSRVQISARRLAILTEGFRGIPQPFKENARIAP
jgi:hypothetical protein